jgi:hypothetical protein
MCLKHTGLRRFYYVGPLVHGLETEGAVVSTEARMDSAYGLENWLRHDLKSNF